MSAIVLDIGVRKDISVEFLNSTHIHTGFLEVLNQLSDGPLTPEEAQDVYDEYLDETKTTIVVAVDNSTRRVVGTGKVSFERKFTHHGRFVAHIDDVVVDSDYRKLGVGTDIVNKLIEIADNFRSCGWSCYKIILCCNPLNEQFYENLGFKASNLEMRYDL